jgi:NAD(P)-dependent dehydrogenase (short-subunit alcohol dehydrogenase family)
MKTNKYGRIVNVSSGAGSLHYMGAGTPAYSISKAALNAFTRILAAELSSGTGILVNSVDPGWVATYVAIEKTVLCVPSNNSK